MLQLGVIRSSKSCWSNPLQMDITTPDRYPIPFITDSTVALSGCTIFSKLDLLRAFYQIPVHPVDVIKTAIITLYQFVKIPFGLRNDAQRFQRLIDQLLRGLHFTYVYIDDVLYSSFLERQHNIWNTYQQYFNVLKNMASKSIKANSFLVSKKVFVQCHLRQKLSAISPSHPQLWICENSLLNFQ